MKTVRRLGEVVLSSVLKQTACWLTGTGAICGAENKYGELPSHIHSFYYVELRYSVPQSHGSWDCNVWCLCNQMYPFLIILQISAILTVYLLQASDKIHSLFPNYFCWRQKVQEMSVLVLCCAQVALQQCSDSTTAKYRVLGRCT